MIRFLSYRALLVMGFLVIIYLWWFKPVFLMLRHGFAPLSWASLIDGHPIFPCLNQIVRSISCLLRVRPMNVIRIRVRL